MQEQHFVAPVRDLQRTRCALHDGAGGVERLVFLTGPEMRDGTRVLSEIVPVKLKLQTSSYVLADPQDCHRTINHLAEQDGHEVHAIVHSHMTTGEGSAQPSQVDIAAQKRIEAIGGSSIGGIFTPDGFVCFFSVAIVFSKRLRSRRCTAVSQPESHAVATGGPIMMFGSRRSYRSRPCRDQAALNQSQALVNGYSLDAFQAASVVITAAGALGSSVAHGLGKKGIRNMTILDDDRVELKNLTRQLFSTKSIGQNKAFALGRDVIDRLFR